jgi:hypothetical protein
LTLNNNNVDRFVGSTILVSRPVELESGQVP